MYLFFNYELKNIFIFLVHIIIYIMCLTIYKAFYYVNAIPFFEEERYNKDL